MRKYDLRGEWDDCELLYKFCGYFLVQFGLFSEMEDGQAVVEELPVAMECSGGISAGILLSFASMYECPVCTGHLVPPILQCRFGHVICSVCIEKLSRYVRYCGI